MSNDPLQPAAYEQVTVAEDTIREWLDSHGAQPVEGDGPGDAAVAISFDASEDDDRALDRDDFFERFDDHDLAFAFDPGPAGDEQAQACRLFERARIEQANRVGDPTDEDDESEPAEGTTGTAGDVQTHPESEPNKTGDGRSSVRHDEATDQENKDNHRDEEPFQS